MNGKNTRYWNNGNIRDELTYKDGKIVDCDYIEYHTEGEKSIVGQYKNGKKEGEWKSYSGKRTKISPKIIFKRSN